MAPCPHAMNERRHQGGTRGDKSDNLAASAAAKPQEESLYESLLRYHEEGKRVKIESIARKGASYDEEQDRKFPAKPRPVIHRSHLDGVYIKSHSTSLQHSNLTVDDHGESSLFPAWEKGASLKAPSLLSKLSSLHQMSLDDHVEFNKPHGLRLPRFRFIRPLPASTLQRTHRTQSLKTRRFISP
jgi:hypothetical protein